MKSVKPGRGPSMMGGVMSILVGVFGLIWTITVLRAGGGLFALFGVVFIIIAIVQAVYNFHNATAKDRFSVVDITGSQEEGDPLNQHFGYSRSQEPDQLPTGEGSSFCPYCGAQTEDDFEFCRKCGKKLPD